MTDSAFFHLVQSNIKGFLREPTAVFWTYGFPLIMVLGLGLAFSAETETITTFTVAASAASNEVIESLEEDPAFQFDVAGLDEALIRLRRNLTPLVVSIDAEGSIEYYFDPTNPEGMAARLAVDDAMQRAAGRRDPLLWTDRQTDAPGSRYIDFLVPGLIGMNIMGAGLWGIGFSTVDLRVRNLLKRLVATPMRRSHFLMAAILSRLFFFVPEMVFLLAVAHLVFGVPIAGSYLSIFVVALMGSLTFAGIGLLTASRANRIESISGLMNLVMIPMWLGSGIFFSSERFPELIQPFIQALPLTQLINALRAVILSGESLFAQGTSFVILGVWCVVTYTLALRWFRWV
jgi:ABC-2 type transport system permease protein